MRSCTKTSTAWGDPGERSCRRWACACRAGRRAARLLETLSFPLVASSANLSGAPAPATLGAVDPGLLAACDLVLDGGPAGGVASTVVDLSRYETTGRWRILRAGVWEAAEIEERLTRRRDDLPRA